MLNNHICSRTATRRDFLKVSAAVAAGFSLKHNSSFAADKTADSEPIIRFGIVTDLHYADADRKGSRYYRDSKSKLKQCVEFMNREKVDFLIEIGDFKDQAAVKSENSTLGFLATIEKTFSRFDGPRYHVLGNHDMDSISKAQFLGHIENTGVVNNKSYYSFDSNGIRFVVMDANYTADGVDYDRGEFDWADANIPDGQCDWLKAELASADAPVIVFVHQRLDGSGNVFVNNAETVRLILQQSKKVLVVFQGHHHEGAYSLLEDIHYYTLKAMVVGAGLENTSHAVVEVDAVGNITVTGDCRAETRKMQKG
jgi:predicted phosphodiesterase